MQVNLRKLAAITLAAAIAFALPGSGDAQSRSDTRIYGGLAVSFGTVAQPGIGAVVGLQSTRLQPSNRLLGFDVHGRYDFQRGFDRIAIAGLIGRRGGYLNLGGGFNPASGELFVTGAAQMRHLRAGVDYNVMSATAAGYFEANTLQRLGRYSPPR